MTDGWIMDAAEEAGWDCWFEGCVKPFGHDLEPNDEDHEVPTNM